MEKLGNKDLGTVKNNSNKTKILWDECWLCFMALARLMAFRVKHRDWSSVAVWRQTSVSVWLSHSTQTLYRYYPCGLCEGIFRMGTITYTCIRGLRVKQTILTTDRVSFVQWHFSCHLIFLRKIKERDFCLQMDFELDGQPRLFPCSPACPADSVLMGPTS